MLFWGGRKRKAKTLRGGRVERRKCPECGETGDFRQVEVKDSYSAFSVKLFDDDYRAFSCPKCGEVMDLDKTLAPALSPREQRQLERQQARELAAARAEREREAASKQRQVDDELEAIKRKLGMD